MENSRGLSIELNEFTHSARQMIRPPRSPFQRISSSNADYISSCAMGAECSFNTKERGVQHHRASSDSVVIDELPSWLEELLDEPEAPVYRFHRRSSSDSIAYLDVSTKELKKDKLKFSDFTAGPSWESQNTIYQEDLQHSSFHRNPSSFDKQKNKTWESSLTCSSDQILGSPCAPQEPGPLPSESTAKEDREGAELPSARNESSNVKHSAPRTDSKRIKQQIAHRSRVKKLQYIAELERNVQMLQAEGAEVSAELGYLDQQIIILCMENRALKQRLQSLSQEQIVKHLEQNMLEREIGRLQFIYQQQQQQLQQKHSILLSANSKDFESQFANLSI